MMQWMSRGIRIAILIGTTAVVVAVVFALPRVAQPISYHDFADQRRLLGVPNFMDVASNLAFLVAGLYGLRILGRSRFADTRERLPYAILFAAVIVTCFGSAYYHLAPSNSTLFWDRLPMTLSFMSFLCAVIAERVSVKAGSALLWPLLLVGILSLLWWRWTETAGRGDLRPYLLVQFYPMLAILLLLLLFPPRYTRQWDLVVIFALYVAAKLLELADRPIFNLGHVVSGHTLKHLAAAVACFWIARMVALRVPLTAFRPQPEAVATGISSQAR